VFNVLSGKKEPGGQRQNPTEISYKAKVLQGLIEENVLLNLDRLQFKDHIHDLILN